MATFIPGKKFISYKHIQARTPEDLEVMMLEICVKSNAPVEFTPPIYSGGWHAWYLYDWSQDVTASAAFEMENKKKKPTKKIDVKEVKNAS